MSISSRKSLSDRSKLIYLGYVAFGVEHNIEPVNPKYPLYPSYFILDTQRIYKAFCTLQDFEDAWRGKGLLQKNIVKSQGLPKLEDSAELDKIWQSFQCV